MSDEPSAPPFFRPAAPKKVGIAAEAASSVGQAGAAVVGSGPGLFRSNQGSKANYADAPRAEATAKEDERPVLPARPSRKKSAIPEYDKLVESDRVADVLEAFGECVYVISSVNEQDRLAILIALRKMFE